MTPRILFPALSLASLLLTAHPAFAQTYHAGAGLTLSAGNTFSIANGGVTGAMIGLPLSLSGSSSNSILSVTNTSSGYGILSASSGDGIKGTSSGSSHSGVAGIHSSSGYGVYGGSTSGTGVYGKNQTSGDYGFLGGTDPVYKAPAGVFGSDPSSAGGNGVFGDSSKGSGVAGVSTSGYGVLGVSSNNDGVYGVSPGTAVYGMNSSSGDYGFIGGFAPSYNPAGNPAGVFGYDNSKGDGSGVCGDSDYGSGVFGESEDGDGVVGYSGTSYGGYFHGNVEVTGTLTAGAKNFKIDHPLDPEHKYLYHASIESDEMTNLYSGNVTTDAGGNATVTMPSWFQALNADFRYQLTCIGGYAPVYVAEEIAGNRFQIAGGKPGMKVSWQVTGVRHDAFALAHPMEVEQDKPEREQGLYQNPEAFGQPESMGLGDQHRHKNALQSQPQSRP